MKLRSFTPRVIRFCVAPAKKLMRLLFPWLLAACAALLSVGQTQAFADEIPAVIEICTSSQALPGECFPAAEEAGALGCSQRSAGFAFAIPGGSTPQIHRIYCYDAGGQAQEFFGADPYVHCPLDGKNWTFDSSRNVCSLTNIL